MRNLWARFQRRFRLGRWRMKDIYIYPKCRRLFPRYVMPKRDEK